MALSPAARVALGLDEPPASPQEWLPAPGGPPRQTNLKLVLKPEEKATTPKIRAMVNELLAGNIEAADYALKSLLAVNPKQGLELYIELAQFSLPKLKAVAVAIDDSSSGSPRNLGFAELQKLLQGD